MYLERVGAAIKDVDLLRLSGTLLESPREAGVSYRLESVIGEGAHGVVFLALQQLPGVLAPVVVKLLRPRAVRELRGLAGAAIGKEIAALKRLSERVPPTPFVVQFLDTGTLRIADSALELPWLAVEYIHGGLEGTTLRARVDYAMSRTGCAFDVKRASSAIKCIAAGMAAIHEVGVLHRDVTPGNVLCCGFDETEVFKVADFGLARVSSASTFGNVLLGTPGYCAPEQSFPDKVEAGPYTDVFGVAATIYFLLTGEAYFSAPSIPEMLVAVQSPERRSLQDARGLCSSIRGQRALCLELDRELSRATRADPRERHQTMDELAAGVLPLLSATPRAGLLSTGAAPRRDARRSDHRKSSPSSLRWTLRRAGSALPSLTSVGWDSNGNFLAASAEGLLFWDGSSYRSVPFDWPWVPRVVRRSGAGRWLLAGDHGMLVDFQAGRVEQRISAGNGLHFVTATGRLDDIVVGATERAGGALELWAWLGGRFMEPLALPDVAELYACAPLADAAWLFVGRDLAGTGVALEFRPLGHRCRVLPASPDSALLVVATEPGAGSAFAAGTRGQVVELAGNRLHELPLPTEEPVGALALEPLGRCWAATPGKLWVRDDGWQLAWSDPSLTCPFVAIMADVGRVIAVTTDGTIVQAESIAAFESS